MARLCRWSPSAARGVSRLICGRRGRGRSVKLLPGEIVRRLRPRVEATQAERVAVALRQQAIRVVRPGAPRVVAAHTHHVQVEVEPDEVAGPDVATKVHRMAGGAESGAPRAP